MIECTKLLQHNLNSVSENIWRHNMGALPIVGSSQVCESNSIDDMQGCPATGVQHQT